MTESFYKGTSQAIRPGARGGAVGYSSIGTEGPGDPLEAILLGPGQVALFGWHCAAPWAEEQYPYPEIDTVSGDEPQISMSMVRQVGQEDPYVPALTIGHGWMLGNGVYSMDLPYDMDGLWVIVCTLGAVEGIETGG